MEVIEFGVERNPQQNEFEDLKIWKCGDLEMWRFGNLKIKMDCTVWGVEVIEFR
jgi:hypothetical protein